MQSYSEHVDYTWMHTVIVLVLVLPFVAALGTMLAVSLIFTKGKNTWEHQSTSRSR